MKFEQKYKLIMESIKNSSLIKEDLDDQQQNIEEELENMGFDTAQPTHKVMMALLDQAEQSPEITKKVYDTIIQQLRIEDYIEQEDGKYFVDITVFADVLYTNFPIDVMQDLEFRTAYKTFQDYYNDTGYDGWSGYGDRDGVIDDYEVINKIEELFRDLGDGTEQNPNIDFSSVYDDQDEDDEDYDDQDEE